ncbi:MAG: phage major capsid protein [Leifsonia sp.]
MSDVIAAKRAMAELGTKAQVVVSDTTLTQAEKKSRLDQYEVELKQHSDTIAISEAAGRLMAGAESAPEAKAKEVEQVGVKSLGTQVIESAGYKSMIAGQSKGVSVEIKAATTINEGIIPAYSGGAGLAGQLLTPQFLPGVVPLLFQPLHIADLIPSGTTSNAAVTYVIESAFQDLTGTVAEKGAIPQLDDTLSRRQDNVSKIANLSVITKEMFQDAQEFQAFLQNRMTFGLQRKEEQQILSGTGTSPDLQGILNRTGLASPVVTAAGLTAVKAMEGIFNQITALRSVSFVEPDAIVIHPTDWQTIRLGKDSNGQYYGGGPFTGAYGNSSTPNLVDIWGYKAIVTTATAQGTVLVGNFSQSAQIWRRDGITLEMTNSDGTNFQSDLLTLKAEERLALAVYRPAGFGVVTLTA